MTSDIGGLGDAVLSMTESGLSLLWPSGFLSRILSYYLTLTIIVTENACWSVETIIFHSGAVITE